MLYFLVKCGSRVVYIPAKCVCISNVIDVIGNFSIPVKGQQKKNEKGGKQSRRREKYGNVKVENVAMAFTVNGLWLHVRNGKKHTYLLKIKVLGYWSMKVDFKSFLSL